MKLLVGLGNPGAKYSKNRHNIGFITVDEIARAYGFSNWRKRFQGEVAEGLIDGTKVMLLKPATYMNESGRSVGEAMRYFNLELKDVFVIHDELDLPVGKMRTKTGGGHAGNNGIRSLKAHIGDDFNRVRVGIGHPGNKNAVHSYVLRDFPKADRQWIEPLVDAITSAAGLLVKGELSSFQNKVHLATAPIKE